MSSVGGTASRSPRMLALLNLAIGGSGLERGIVAEQAAAKELGQGVVAFGRGGAGAVLDDLAAGLVAAAAYVVQAGAGVEAYGHHLVLGQGAGLVGADEAGTAQGLDGGELADEGVAARHALHADGEGDGDDGRQPLGDGGNGRGDGGEEQLDELLHDPPLALEQDATQPDD